MVLALESIVFMILVIDQSGHGHGHGHADMVKDYPHHSIVNSAWGKMAERKVCPLSDICMLW